MALDIVASIGRGDVAGDRTLYQRTRPSSSHEPGMQRDIAPRRVM